jgi:hypothetical protein
MGREIRMEFLFDRRIPQNNQKQEVDYARRSWFYRIDK